MAWRLTAEPGAHALVPDELHVLVTRETERHHECPGAADLTRGRIDQVGTGAEVHLRGFARRKGQAHRRLGGLLAADLGDQPAHAGVEGRPGIMKNSPKTTYSSELKSEF